MPQSHVPFEKIYEDANYWLKDIADRMGHPEKQHAYHALRGVLFALRDRLPTTEVFQLSSHLPTMIRGIFFEGYVPAGKPVKMNRDAFVQAVAEELQKVNAGNPLDAIEAVIATMDEQLGAEPLMHVLNVLPKDLQDLLEPVRARIMR